MLRTPRGTRDFLPEQMIKREYVISVIKKIFERYGFNPLETPAIEFESTLRKKYGEEEKLIWAFEDLGKRRVALRYDLTVPLARVVASNPQLKLPFKRYQIQPAWRFEEPQKGRYREFYQCDVDIVGSESMAADAEIISIIYDVMKELSFEEFTIRINDRKLLDTVAKFAGIRNKVFEVFRAIDKLDKIGLDGVKEDMIKRGISKESIDKILEVISITGSPDEVLNRVEKMVGKNEGIEELRALIKYLDALEVDRNYWKIDLSLARGLDYYTGPVFETMVEKPRIGSLTGGGRFDKLIGIFSGKDIPATGTTIGIERIIDALDEMGRLNLPKTKTRIFVAPVNKNVYFDALKITKKIRDIGINSGSLGYIVVSIANAGKQDAEFVVLKVLGSEKIYGVEPSEVYIGTIKSDDYDSEKIEFYTKKDISSGEYRLPVELSYRDMYGRKYNETYYVSFTVTDKEKSGIFLWFIFILVLLFVAYMKFGKKLLKKRK